MVACGSNAYGQCNTPELEAGRKYVPNYVRPNGNVLLQAEVQDGVIKLVRLNGEVACEIDIQCTSDFQNITMLHSHVSNFLACRVEIISPHGERLSERIKIDPSSTLTDFCFGFEDNREVEKDNEQEAEDFGEDGVLEESRWKRNKIDSKPSMSRNA